MVLKMSSHQLNYMDLFRHFKLLWCTVAPIFDDDYRHGAIIYKRVTRQTLLPVQMFGQGFLIRSNAVRLLFRQPGIQWNHLLCAIW